MKHAKDQTVFVEVRPAPNVVKRHYGKVIGIGAAGVQVRFNDGEERWLKPSKVKATIGDNEVSPRAEPESQPRAREPMRVQLGDAARRSPHKPHKQPQRLQPSARRRSAAPNVSGTPLPSQPFPLPPNVPKLGEPLGMPTLVAAHTPIEEKPEAVTEPPTVTQADTESEVSADIQALLEMAQGLVGKAADRLRAADAMVAQRSAEVTEAQDRLIEAQRNRDKAWDELEQIKRYASGTQ